jgi:hypothetical protein
VKIVKYQSNHLQISEMGERAWQTLKNAAGVSEQKKGAATILGSKTEISFSAEKESHSGKSLVNATASLMS